MGSGALRLREARLTGEEGLAAWADRSEAVKMAQHEINSTRRALMELDPFSLFSTIYTLPPA
jgi:hypothetical protein